jgi:hypothetical protein
MLKSSKHELEPYWGIVGAGLSSRRVMSGAMNVIPEHKAPQYVVTLCEALLAQLHSVGATHLTLKDLTRLEATCTGADYQHKLALRCLQLERPVAA